MKRLTLLFTVLGASVLSTQQTSTGARNIVEIRKTQAISPSNRALLDSVLKIRHKLDSIRLKNVKDSRVLKQMSVQLQQQDSILNVFN